MECAERRGWVAAGALCALLSAGCASPPAVTWASAAPPLMLVGVQDAGVRDLRADYRSAACTALPAGGKSCDDVLLRLPGEGNPTALPPPRDLAQRFRVVFVPGLFSECFGRYARPLSDAEAALTAEGFAVDYVAVRGRGTSARNASIIADHFTALADDPRPIIVVAYSKGLPDTLAFVVGYPRTASRIAAIVSIAGAANGSPLADDLSSMYRRWAAPFPLPDCEPGTGDEIHDLRRDVRLEWWRANGRVMNVPVFSLVATPRPEQVSPATRLSYRRLARLDPRNDGKLLAQDQVVPGGYLLGYANADHWSIAIPMAEAFPSWSALYRDGVPRTILVRAAIDVVAATLAARPASPLGDPVSTGRAETP